MAMVTPPSSGDERSSLEWGYEALPHVLAQPPLARAIPAQTLRRPPSSPALLAASAPQRGIANPQVPSPPGSWRVEVGMPASLQQRHASGPGLGRLRVQALAAAQRSPRSSDAAAARKDRFIRLVLPDTTPQAGEDEADDEARQEVRRDPCGRHLAQKRL
jgi:hypothetical protein